MTASQRLTVIIFILATGVLPAACQNDSGSEPEDKPASTELVVVYQPNTPGAQRQQRLISCSQQTASEDCRILFAADRKIFDPLPQQRICTKIYGGPQVITIRGQLQGQKLAAQFSRQDGCQLQRWEQLAPLWQSLGFRP